MNHGHQDHKDANNTRKEKMSWKTNISKIFNIDFPRFDNQLTVWGNILDEPTSFTTKELMRNAKKDVEHVAENLDNK